MEFEKLKRVRTLYLDHSSISATRPTFIAFSRNERTHPNFVSFAGARNRNFLRRLQIGRPSSFSRDFGPRFRVHRCKSARPAENP